MWQAISRPSTLLQFLERGQQHHLQAARHVQFALHALVVAAQRLVQTR